MPLGKLCLVTYADAEPAVEDDAGELRPLQTLGQVDAGPEEKASQAAGRPHQPGLHVAEVERVQQLLPALPVPGLKAGY